jgi:hypothetical protein
MSCSTCSAESNRQSRIGRVESAESNRQSRIGRVESANCCCRRFCTPEINLGDECVDQRSDSPTRTLGLATSTVPRCAKHRATRTCRSQLCQSLRLVHAALRQS